MKILVRYTVEWTARRKAKRRDGAWSALQAFPLPGFVARHLLVHLVLVCLVGPLLQKIHHLHLWGLRVLSLDTEPLINILFFSKPPLVYGVVVFCTTRMNLKEELMTFYKHMLPGLCAPRRYSNALFSDACDLERNGSTHPQSDSRVEDGLFGRRQSSAPGTLTRHANGRPVCTGCWELHTITWPQYSISSKSKSHQGPPEAARSHN